MKLKPNNSKFAPSSTENTINGLVLYENDSAPILGYVISAKSPQRLSVLSEFGATVELPPMRLHPLPGNMPIQNTSTESRVAFLKELHIAARTATDTIVLHDVWEFVCSESREYSVDELTELYFGKNEISSHLALRLALNNDRVFFKRNLHRFLPRPIETVAELERTEEVRRARGETLQRTVAEFQRRLNDPGYELTKETLPFLRLLEDLACEAPHQSPAHFKEAKNLLEQCLAELKRSTNPLDLAPEYQGSEARLAFGLLDALGIFSRNTNPALIRYRPALDFSSSAIAYALSRSEIAIEAVPASSWKPGQRRDETALEALTIDDASTRDIDDALTVEFSADGYRLGVHISDVASTLEHDSVLDLEARARATSIYLPDRTIHMLPRELSAQACSLVAGQPRRALSCFFNIDRSCNILSSEIIPTLIKVHHRLDYVHVDALLERTATAVEQHVGPELLRTLETLYQISTTHQSQRFENGALQMTRREKMVRVSSDGKLSLEEYDEQSAARSMVGEMMIMMNVALAKYAAENRIPFIYRSQEPPERNNTPTSSTIPEGPAREYAERSGLKRSLTNLRPAPHASLGVKRYTQATSPIRRYADLLNQRQICAHLSGGQAPYRDSDLVDILKALDEPLGLANGLSKESKRFWFLRYLEEHRSELAELHAVVLRTDLKQPLVELEELAITTLLRPTAPVKPGDRLQLKIAGVDARFDWLKLEVVS